jgi:hypothetical protein
MEEDDKKFRENCDQFARLLRGDDMKTKEIYIDATGTNPEKEGISQSLYDHLLLSKDPKNIYDQSRIGDNKKRIWLPKAICIVSYYPYFDFFSQILIDIWFTLFYS